LTVYSDLLFYKNEYEGRNTKLSINHLRDASRIIDLYTLNQIDPDNIPEEVRYCCCALGEVLLKYQTLFENSSTTEPRIASAKVGDLSKSYSYQDVSLDDIENSKSKEIKSTIYTWLGTTGLLYRGVR
jgi:hypothetical protein